MTKQNKIFIGISLVIIYVALLLKSQDPDMFFTIASGRELLNGNFHFNNHTDLPILVQQWLYAIILAKVDNFGYIGHILFVLIQNIILWIVSYIFIYNRTNDKTKSIIGPIILTIICQNYLINIRPQIITMICLVSELVILDIYKKSKQLKTLLWLIPIYILSANMHQAIYLYHIYIMIPYMIDLDLNNHKFNLDIKIILNAFIVFLCSIITPYGLNGMLFIFKVFKANVFEKFSTNEMKSISILSLMGILLILMMLYVIILNYLHKSNIYLNYFCITIFFLSLHTVRHTSILYIALLFILIDIPINFKIPNLYLLSIIFFSTLILISRFDEPLDIRKTDSSTILTDTSYLPKDAKIFNSMNIGSYLEYLGYNNIFIDTRPELYTTNMCGEERIDDYRAVMYGSKYNYGYLEDEDIINIVKDYEYVILDKKSYSSRILDSIAENIYENEFYTIYKK